MELVRIEGYDDCDFCGEVKELQFTIDAESGIFDICYDCFEKLRLNINEQRGL